MFSLEHIQSPKSQPIALTADSIQFSSAITFLNQWSRGETNFEQQTSGSTGTPKEILLTREQLLASAVNTSSYFNFTPDSTLICPLDTKYIAGKMMLVRALVSNCRLILTPPNSSPLSWLKKDLKVDFIPLVPQQLDINLLESLSIDQILLGGASISPEIEASILSYSGSASIYHSYGMTETVSHIALRELPDEQFFSVLRGNEIKLDQRGCLAIKGAVTQDTWIQTNDICEIKSPNLFQWLGRADLIINSGGVKVQIEKVEQAIRECGINQDFQIIAIPDPTLGEKVCLASSSTLDFKKLQTQISDHLHPYEIPKEFFLTELSFTPTHKPDRIKTSQSVQETNIN
jgi:O-succinylbenzoic acid--CoA ligase